MKKLLIILASIMFALVACDNGGMNKENEGKPDGGINPETNSPYYQHEASNISVYEDESVPGTLQHIISWENPTDTNFSHVLFSVTSDPNHWGNQWTADNIKIDQSTNTYTFDVIVAGIYYCKYTVTIVCVSKDGNESKGVEYSYYSKYYDPNEPHIQT